MSSWARGSERVRVRDTVRVRASEVDPLPLTHPGTFATWMPTPTCARGSRWAVTLAVP